MGLDDSSGGVDVSGKSDSQGGDGEAEGGEHGDAAVLELRLPEVGHPLRAVLAELEGIELQGHE